ncbi:MAG: ATP-grasp domain-containing protein, partial [Sulfurifustis sp.]
GGQTPLKLAQGLERAGAPIIGTTPDSIDIAEDRERFQKLVKKLKLMQPPNATARTTEAAVKAAEKLGYPLVVRPSYVLGGRAMEIVHTREDLEYYMRHAVRVSEDSPVLLDRFLSDAAEVDVDAVADGTHVVIGGIMEHIEEAGVHSGDSACSLPPFSLSAALQDELRRQTVQLAKALKVVGLMNVQYAVKAGEVYLLEVNPRASRTIPYVSKATGRPLAKIAARCMVGKRLRAQGITDEIIPSYFSVKEAVFPFIKFPGVDTILGPEMKSTGEVMGVGRTFGEAFAKSQVAAGAAIPRRGRLFVSVRDADQPGVVEIVRYFADNGFDILATRGTAAAIQAAGIPVKTVNKVSEGRPHIVDMIMNDEIDIIINTVSDKQSLEDSYAIRRQALQHRVTNYTTLAAARAAREAHGQMQELRVNRLQDLHGEISA